MAAKALFVHVPVDKIRMYNGPGTREWIAIRDQLKQHEADTEAFYVECGFTLRTDASERSFSRKLKLASIRAPNSNYTWLFTAIFCGQIVSGVYNSQARAGWFSLD